MKVQTEIYCVQIESPLGPLSLFASGNQLIQLQFFSLAQPQKTSALLEEACHQLGLYFSSKLQRFDLPLNPKGTDFQRSAWEVLQQIPYGETLSYQSQASQMGRPKAQRAVGSANGRNPLPILIPCHRVVSKDGGLGGYSSGLERKRSLLGLEGHRSW